MLYFNMEDKVSVQLVILLAVLTSMSIHTICDNHRDFEDFKECIEQEVIQGYLAVQNTTLYNKLNHHWNIRIPQVSPLAYFVPNSTKDVQVAVSCGRKTNVRITAKSGGHSYESYSSGDSNTVVIDFRNMSKVVIDKVEGTAVIGPGALLGTIMAKTAVTGYGLPMGQCFSVGIGGHALGGGVGYFINKYGLTSDNILEMTMVDASGNVHIVNAIENQDLYWALRGVGSGDIGLVTNFKFKLFPTANITINLVKLEFKMEDVDSVLHSWQNWLIWTQANEPSIFSDMWFYIGSDEIKRNEIFLDVMNVQENGNKNRPDENTLLEKVLKFFPTPANTSETFPPFLKFLINNGFTSSDPKPTSVDLNYLENLRKWNNLPLWKRVKSFFVDKTFDGSKLKDISNLIRRMSKKNAFLEFTAFGGKVNAIPGSETAYVHRSALYNVGAYGYNNDGSGTGMAWVNEFISGTKFMDSGESSQNLVDKDYEEGNAYLKRYYGSNLQRLIEVKSKWDPDNYFRNPESIPVQTVVPRGGQSTG